MSKLLLLWNHHLKCRCEQVPGVPLTPSHPEQDVSSEVTISIVSVGSCTPTHKHVIQSASQGKVRENTQQNQRFVWPLLILIQTLKQKLLLLLSAFDQEIPCHMYSFTTIAIRAMLLLPCMYTISH